MKSLTFCLLLMLCWTLPCAAQKEFHHTENTLRKANLNSSAKGMYPHLPASRAAAPFPDVPKDHWAAAAVETLRQRGIIIGYPAGK